MGSAPEHNRPSGKPTLQARSADTLERILRAAERLLPDREFDQITMAELATEAGCAVGTVYGRVENKEHLLFCLHERFTAAAAERVAETFGGLGDADLQQRVEALCVLMVDIIHDHRGVTRALTNHLYASSSQAASQSMRAFREQGTAMFRGAAAFLADRMPDSANPETQAACVFALLAAQDVAQGRIVYGARSGLDFQYSLEELKQRTAELILRYLNAHIRENSSE